MFKEHISYLKRQDIDEAKWNACISNSPNCLIYPMSFYLDAIADNWDALIIEDYKAVMPLPFKKKYGIKYFYEPAFTQQLGLIGAIDHINIEDLVRVIITGAKYGDISFNYNNRFILPVPGTKMRTNLIIDLEKGYEEISSCYKKSLNTDLKKASQFELTENGDIKETIELYRNAYEKNIGSIRRSDYENFYKLCLRLKEKDRCFVFNIKNKNQLLAAGLLLKDEHRLYNLINVSTPAGKKTTANRFLFDSMIRKFSGQKLVFDFEGSSVAGIKKFYLLFGAGEQPYFHWHYNHLPAVIKAFKK